MLTSIRWLNKLLSPGAPGQATLSADEAERVLTNTSFPIEPPKDEHGVIRTPSGHGRLLPDGDVILDVEVTSNRGDCLCHLGLAREIAAATGRRLLVPAPDLSRFPGGPAASTITSVTSEAGALCPRFTARVIRGVRVGPSPAWLAQALESIGQRPINNIVDISNYVLFEIGHPNHVFDLNTLAGRRLIVRQARPGEAFTALDGRTHKLIASDLVVADAEKAQSLAGVIGGLSTGVTGRTTDVLLEVATWDPPTIRRTARRLNIVTDAGRRFERFVDPRDLEWASARAAELILEIAGGTLCEGMIDVGPAACAPAPRTAIDLRVERCAHVLGIDVPAPRMKQLLEAVGVEAAGVSNRGGATVLSCLAPHHRPDLTREIDLIEEVARLNQIDNIPVASSLPVRLDAKHPPEWSRREKAMREAAAVLTGAGFYETVTFSFLPKDAAARFLPKGLRLVKIDEERRKDMPYLRPSLIPSLLNCMRANREAMVHGGAGASGGSESIRFYEAAAVFAEEDDGEAYARKTVEHVNVGMVLTAPAGMKAAAARQHALRALRGTIETLVARLGGTKASAGFTPREAIVPAFDAAKGGVTVGISINGAPAGYLGLLADPALAAWSIEEPVAAAEVDLASLVALYPPAANVQPLPHFPGIDRELTLDVPEATPWARVDALVNRLKLDLLVGHRFVTAYRGKPVRDGAKAVTLSLHFRSPERTLKKEEVEPQMSALIDAAKSELSAELRGG